MRSAPSPVNVADVTSFDVEHDVVIAGYGCAGASAAISASVEGASVLVLERAGGWGGASAMSGGLIYLGGGTSIQRALGYEDSVDDMYAVLEAATGPGVDTAKLALYCEGSVDHFDWLVSCGVPFKPSLYAGSSPEPETDDGLMWLCEQSAPFDRIATPVPRAHVPTMTDKRPGERGGGWMLMKCLADTVERAGVEVSYDTGVERLIVDPDGAVVGLVARRFGEPITVRARGGVVLASGGFIENDAMLELHAPQLLQPGVVKLGAGGDDGSGIRMAQAVGAAVRHMDAGEVAFLGGLMPRTILVNDRGQRFINEDTYFGRIGQAVLYTQRGRSIVVLDDEINESYSQTFGWQPPSVVADDLETLGKALDLPDGSLEATVELYNAHAERGEDLTFGKRPEHLRPLRPPYGAIDLREPGGPFICFTLGGLHTDVDGVVHGVDGEPIPGLFAAGRTTSGIPAWGYMSGTSLGDGTFFGRRAGRAAARSAVTE